MHRRHANSPLLGKGSCLFDEWGDALVDNTFNNNGGFGNPTNGDFAQLNLEKHPSDCYSGNTDTAGTLTADSAAAAAVDPDVHDDARRRRTSTSPFLNEVLCDSQVKLNAVRLPAG